MILELYQLRNKVKSFAKNTKLYEYNELIKYIPHIRTIFKNNVHNQLKHLSQIPLNVTKFIIRHHNDEKLIKRIANTFIENIETNPISNYIVETIQNKFLEALNQQNNDPKFAQINYIKLRSCGINRNQVDVIKQVVKST